MEYAPRRITGLMRSTPIRAFRGFLFNDKKKLRFYEIAKHLWNINV
jgi:hypothetical protein